MGKTQDIEANNDQYARKKLKNLGPLYLWTVILEDKTLGRFTFIVLAGTDFAAYDLAKISFNFQYADVIITGVSVTRLHDKVVNFS